ncbi:MAG TPA: tetratricopeptide repeat protein [Pyrinomonadaceae bacterium]|nr:tetratricopeptide repeat protein [Pyrinomonadaceae bacterium]
MKRCPECRRDYHDDSLLYCLDDGSTLLDGPSSTGAATAILHRAASANEALTRAQISAAEAETGPQAPGQAAGKPSIAVLPFANISKDPDNEYFCDGLAEELLNALAKIDDLKVAARTSAFSFKGRNANVSEIAAALKVDTVLEGSVRRQADRIRITTQLISAADGYHLWSERYDREMKDIFDVQDEIALAVVDALKVKLLGTKQAAVLKRYTENAEALDFYLRGLSYFAKFTPEYFQKAIESFTSAIEIDPNYAPPYAGLAESYCEMSFFASAHEWMPKAKASARKALEVDDTLGSAHNALAVTLMYYDRDFPGAEKEFQRAISLDPGSAHIHMWYGWFLGLMRRFDEAEDRVRHARGLDPLSHLINLGIGAIYLWSGKLDRAVEELSRVVDLNPNFPISYIYLAEAYVEKREFAAALATLDNAPITFNDPISRSAVAYVYAKAGGRDKAFEMLAELEGESCGEFDQAVYIAKVYLALDDTDRAFGWLEKACNEHSVWLIWMGVDPAFDPLRHDQRFMEMLKRMNLPQ